MSAIPRWAACRYSTRRASLNTRQAVALARRALWLLCREVVRQNLWAIGIILASEAAAILTCAIKFGKYPATHSWLAKFYGLCLLAGLIALLAFDAGNWAVISLAIVAALANTEIILMHVLAKAPPGDVKSIFHLPR